MTLWTTDTRTGQRRIVLIDFDWQDADLLPELLRQPGISVRLVAGERPDDAGVRVAELCGLPRTVDLADLTREIFDVALVGERSKRRTQLEGLMLALGTPCVSPQGFLRGDGDGGSAERPAIEAPLALHAAALEDALGGHGFEEIIEQALPDFAGEGPTEPQPVVTGRTAAMETIDLSVFPSPQDRHGLELALHDLMRNTGAASAEIHTGNAGALECVAKVGSEDPLLRGLVETALSLNAPQVVSSIAGPLQGKAWGAWPFRTTQRRGVIAAAAIDPAAGWTRWERMVEEIRATWDERDRQLSAPAFPLVPDLKLGFLDPDDFRARLELAVERHSRDGLRFEVHRLVFADAEDAVTALCDRLQSQLRDTDCITRALPLEILLLTAGAAGSFVHLRRRIVAQWEEVWSGSGRPHPAPPITDEHVAMSAPAEAENFLGAACLWLSRR